MSSDRYEASDTALLLVDPYNDFLSEGGKLWPPVKESAEAQNLVPNMKSVVAAVRTAGIRVFYVPHHRAEPGDMDHWQCATPYQQSAAKIQVFGKDTWGGEWHPDFVPQEGDVITKEALHAAHHINGPTYASAILSTSALLHALK